MTSMQWVYQPFDEDARRARFAAMNYADDELSGRILAKERKSDLEEEALLLRQSELTWSARQRVGREAQVVRVRIAQVFWAVVLAEAFVGLIAALLYIANIR